MNERITRIIERLKTKVFNAVTIFQFCLFFSLIGTLHYFYLKQEKNVIQKFNQCSFYTVMTPLRMPDTHKMYFYYYFNGKRYESSGSVGSGDLGFFYTKKSALSNRYWVQVYCNNLRINRVLWEIPVPDTLSFIPTNGWNKIPYDLDKTVQE